MLIEEVLILFVYMYISRIPDGNIRNIAVGKMNDFIKFSKEEQVKVRLNQKHTIMISLSFP